MELTSSSFEYFSRFRRDDSQFALASSDDLLSIFREQKVGGRLIKVVGSI